MTALRVGLIGCGPRGLEHGEAAAAVPGLEPAGVADHDPDRAGRAAERLGVRAFESIEALLAEARPEIVVVATPPRGRGPLIESLTEAPGLRGVLAEKPLALRLDEAEALVAACDRRGIVLAVGHQTRHSVPFLRLRATIESGDLGEIEFLRAVGYGNLLDQGNHVVDTLRWLVGGEVTWVMSQAERDLGAIGELLPADLEPWSDDDHPAPMWMTHHLAFEHGPRAAMETGLLYQRSAPFADDWLQRRIAVTGTEGFAEARISGAFRALSRSGERIEPDDFGELPEATRALHADLRDAVLTGHPPSSSGADALRTLRVVLACLASAQQGRLIRPDSEVL